MNLNLNLMIEIYFLLVCTKSFHQMHKSFQYLWYLVYTHLVMVCPYRKLLHNVFVIEKNVIARQEKLEELKSSLMSIAKKKSTRQEELQALELKYKTMQEQLTQSIEAAKR